MVGALAWEVNSQGGVNSASKLKMETAAMLAAVFLLG
jgi:hypothetical protein